MDNRTVDVTSQGKEHLRAALSILFGSSKATHCCELKLVPGKPGTVQAGEHQEDPSGIPTLIFSTGLIQGQGQKNLFPLDLDAAVNTAIGWLDHVQYPPEPGIDGDCEKGWRVFTESWGHVAGSYHGIAGIQPRWALYGK